MEENYGYMDWESVFSFPAGHEIDRLNAENRRKNRQNVSTRRSPYLAVQWDPGRQMRIQTIRCDVRAGHTPKGTYLCAAQWGMDLTGLRRKYPDAHHQTKGVGGYAGLQISEKQPQAILSLWDVFYTDENGTERRIRPKQIWPPSETAEFGGEGTGAHRIAPYPWKAGNWYQLLVFCYPGDTDEHNTWVELQILNPEEEGAHWERFAVYDTGLPDSCFTGPLFSFLENYLTPYAGDVRTMEMRNMLLRDVSGAWYSPKQSRISASMAGTPKYRGSYAWGRGAERLWLITSGAGEDQSGRNSGQKPETVDW